VETFTIKRNDTLPALEAVLSDDSGPVDLSGATVFFTMTQVAANSCGEDAPVSGSAKFKKQGVVVGLQSVGSPTRGKVRYEWSGTDTDTAGLFAGEFEVQFGSSGRWTFPSVGTIPILVSEDIA
jgi:hypothetical protein